MVRMMKLIQHELFTQKLVLQIQNMTRKKKKECKGEGGEIYQNGFMKCSLVVFANPSSCRNWQTKSR